MQTKTEKIEAAIAEAITTGRDPALNEYEQRLYDQLAMEIRTGVTSTAGEIWRMDYIRQPPSMEQFLLDDYYLGSTWKPVEGENDGIWPGWFKQLTGVLNYDSRIHNLVLTGSLGTGKTSLSVTILLYRICIATLLKNPQNFFGLNRNSPIVYNLLSVTKEAVKDTAFGYAMGYMGDSPYFKESCKFDPDSDYSSFRIEMKNTLPDGRKSGIWVTGGSKGQHVLGRNLLGICLDEGNFRLEKDPDLTAYELYDQVRTRIANRFQKIASYLPAISIIASSAQDESSFTEKVCKEIEESNRQREQANANLPEREKTPPSQMIIRNAIYHIKRHALTGITPDHKWFKVAYGLKNMEPFILSGFYTEKGEPVGEGPHEEPPNGASTELVPTFYWEAYKRNTKAQLQNLSGISVGGSHRLFASLVDIEQCLYLSEKEGVPNPMLPGMGIIPISQEDDRNIWDYLNHPAFLTRVASAIQPLRHPQHFRYIHLDLATQNLAGLAVCHLAGSKLVDGLVHQSQPFSEYRLIVEYDFILTICAGQTKPISLEKIQNFVFWLRDYCGYRIGLVTSDQFQSETSLQMLESRGIKTDRLSIDKDKSAYHAWRAAFQEQRVRLYRNEQMMREAAELLEMDKKYDHPTNGSKDTCDACSGALLGAINSEEKITMFSTNAPSVYNEGYIQKAELGVAPIAIPLPAKGYDRERHFDV